MHRLLKNIPQQAGSSPVAQATQIKPQPKIHQTLLESMSLIQSHTVQKSEVGETGHSI